MAGYRDEAHNAMHELWKAADGRLREPDATQRDFNGHTEYRVETGGGATIIRLSGYLSVSADFDKLDGTEETTTIEFPYGVSDLSETRVLTDWVKDGRSGTNTPPIRDFPHIAQEFVVLI